MKQVKPFIALAIIALIGYLMFEFVPPYLHNYELQNFVDEAAKQDTYLAAKSEDQVRQDVMAEAQSDNIALAPEQIQIVKTGTSCSISVAYNVHVALPVFPQDLHFTAASANKNIVY